MEKIILLTVMAILLWSCQGSLTDEQRRQMREGREKQTIKKVSEAEITMAAFDLGKAIVEEIGQRQNKVFSLDSLGKAHKVNIHLLQPGGRGAQAIETQILDAYITGVISGNINDNVQKLGADSLLYTRPLIKKLEDGSEQLEGVWSLHISKKELILSMDDNY